MRLARLVTPAVVLALLPTVPLAHPSDQDPPSRVGRLSFLAGPVSFRPGSLDDWGAATVNYPLTTGDHLWTDADARAEITVGSSAIRLAQETAFGFLTLDDRTTQIRLSQGALNVRLRDLDEDEVFEIDTPNGAVSLLRPGEYRVDVDSTGDTTTVTVRHGQAEVTAAGAAFSVRSREAAVVAGIDYPSYDIRDARSRDAWEDWCAARDRRWDDARSARYVSRDMIGYEDLDDNGEWRETEPYGAVWVPRTVVVGWAPYRYGHWAWVDPWGWTWIDDAPWGFAPFHYGRWAYVDGGWAWVPGQRVLVRPVYAPALVVFIGGRNWSVAITSGGTDVAWFPLAPDEPYVPVYRVSDTYVRNVNVTNVNITNINVTNVNVRNITYRNRNAPGAVTVVTRQTFVESRPVDRRVIVVSRERLAAAPVVGMTPSVAPGRRSVLAPQVTAVAHRPPAVATRRAVVARTTPPPPPVPFTMRQQALRERPGRPVDDATLESLRARSPATRANQLVRPATPAAPPSQTGAALGLKPAREGLPATRPLPATGFTPRPDRQPSPPTAREPDRPAPAEPPPRGERPAPAARPAPPAAERPAPALPARPAPTPRERPKPAPAAKPAPAPAERPAPAEPKGEPARPPQPPAERRAAPAAPPATPPPAERRPEKERKVEKERRAEKDTTQDQGKKPK